MDALFAAIIGGIGLILWIPYDIHAFFNLDDFAMLEHYVLGTWLPTYRPTFKVVMTLAYWLFGRTPIGYYVCLGVIVAVCGMLMYFALRALGLSRVPSFIAGLGLLGYPRADSTGLWWSDPAGVALLFGILSVYLGAMWIRREANAWRWLIPSLVSLTVSILCYEALFPITLIFLCLLPLSLNPRRSSVYFLISTAMSLTAAGYMFAAEHVARQAQPLSAYLRHATHLASNAWQAYVIHGFNSARPGGAILVAMAIVIASLAYHAVADASHLADREPMRRLVISAALLGCGALASLAPFVPASGFYEPTLLTIGNRVNSLSQVFIVTAIGILIWLTSRYVTRWSRSVIVPVLVASVATISIVGGYVSQVEKDQMQYNAASALRRTIIARIKQIAPTVQSHSQVLLAGYSEYIGPSTDRWFGTIIDQWDTSAILQMIYHTAGVSGYPMARDTKCLSRTISIPQFGVQLDYGEFIVIDVHNRRILRVANKAMCEADTPSMVVTLVATSANTDGSRMRQ